MSEFTGVDYIRLQAIKDKHERMEDEVSRNELEVKIGSVHGDRACLLKAIEHLQVALMESQQRTKMSEGNYELLKTALTREINDERVAIAAAYWLDCSPHERTEADGIILARYARKAMAELAEAQQTIARKQLYIEKLELSRESAQEAADNIAKEKGLELFEAQQTIARQCGLLQNSEELFRWIEDRTHGSTKGKVQHARIAIIKELADLKEARS